MGEVFIAQPGGVTCLSSRSGSSDLLMRGAAVSYDPFVRGTLISDYRYISFVELAVPRGSQAEADIVAQKVRSLT